MDVVPFGQDMIFESQFFHLSHWKFNFLLVTVCRGAKNE